MPKFAKRMEDMMQPASVIRGLFSTMGDPALISFGGGAPAAEALPIESVREILSEVVTRDGRGVEALQYGTVLGAADLRKVVVEDLLAPKGIQVSPEQVMIVTGGLETMNLICQLYIEPGDVILVEQPTFVQVVEIFKMFQATVVEVEMDDNGVILEDLEAKIQQYNPKMFYVIPTFQNPTGITLTRERREKVAELGSKYDMIILEDDPYRDIRYSGEELPPIMSFDTTGHTVLANSFSKIFSPGSRLGYVVASPEIIDKLFDAKTATNSHTSMLPQIVCAEFFKRGYYEPHLEMICNLYRERRDTMIRCIDEYLPEGTKRVFPDGGLFSWVELPFEVDTAELLKDSIAEAKVAFVAGEAFYAEPNARGRRCMRLGFGSVPSEKIEEGMKRLGALIHKKMQEQA